VLHTIIAAQVQRDLNVPVGLSHRVRVRQYDRLGLTLQQLFCLHLLSLKMATEFACGNVGTDVHLAVLVPTAKSWPDGRASVGAIALAVDAANARGGLFGGGRILYTYAEVACDRFQAGAALSKLLEEGPVDAVIGPDCSVACESTAYITAVRGLPQISYSCSSSALSDKAQFPTVRLSFSFCSWRAADVQ